MLTHSQTKTAVKGTCGLLGLALVATLIMPNMITPSFSTWSAGQELTVESSVDTFAVPEGETSPPVSGDMTALSTEDNSVSVPSEIDPTVPAPSETVVVPDDSTASIPPSTPIESVPSAPETLTPELSAS